MFVKKYSPLLALAALFLGTTGYESKKDVLEDKNTPTRCDSGKEIPGLSKTFTPKKTEFSDVNKKLILFDNGENGTLDGKICKAYIPKEPLGKPLYILILGHVEEFDWSSDECSMIHFYERLKKEDKGIVLLFRTGLAAHGVGSMLNPEEKYKYEPKAVLRQTEEILAEATKMYNPEDIRCGGFSWGAGTLRELAKHTGWRKNSKGEIVPVKRSLSLDPIAWDWTNFGVADRTIPPFENPKGMPHLNYWAYQRNNNLSFAESLVTLQGNYPIKIVKTKDGKLKTVKDERPGNVIKYISKTTHLKMDNSKLLRDEGFEFITAKEKVSSFKFSDFRLQKASSFSIAKAG